MGGGVPSVGQKLKETREAKGLTLRDVQEATKIRLRYLEALESGHWDVFPGRVYVRGYIRAYAQFLGLPPDPLLHLWDESHPEEEDGADGPPPEKGRQEPLAARAQARAARPARRPWLWLLVLALLAGGGWWLWAAAGRGTEDSSVQQPPGPAVPGAEPAPPVEEAPPPPAEPPPPTVEKETANTLVRYQVKGASSLEVLLTFSAPCWISVRADGQVVEAGRTFQKGQTLTVTAAEKITVRVGYPPGLQVTILGQDQGLLAEKKSALDVEILLAP
ncbi:MAG: DUF4115 domain-containing protein [Bacillota bacterium]|nr:DUF4115 domain-containing protein [Bacillota bacterium]